MKDRPVDGDDGQALRSHAGRTCSPPSRRSSAPKPWAGPAEQPRASDAPAAVARDDPEGETAFAAADVLHRHLRRPPTGTQVRDLVEEVGREHGFDDTAHVKDEPGDLDMVGEDKYGGRYEFGMAKNTDLRRQAPAVTAGTRSPHRRLDAMTAPDPTADARQVAVELARMVGRVSARGDLPEAFADQLLAPEADGALAILLDTADTAQPGSGGALGPDLLARLAEGLITSADRVSRSRAVVPLVESLRHHPEVAAELLAREELLDALVGGPRRPRLDRALVRVLLAVAPLRSPATVADRRTPARPAGRRPGPARPRGHRPPRRVLRRPGRPEPGGRRVEPSCPPTT